MRQRGEPEELHSNIYAVNPAEAERIRRITREVVAPLSINVIMKELEKPQGGGGKGVELPYMVEILLDGERAFTLRADSFAQVGQMQRFIDLMRDPKAAPPAPPKAARRPRRYGDEEEPDMSLPPGA